MVNEQKHERPQPSYGEGKPRVPEVAERIEHNGVERSVFLGLVKKAATTAQKTASSRSVNKEDARTKA